MTFKTHHIGIKVSSIDKNSKLYEQLGYTIVSKEQIDWIQNNKILFLKSNDNTHVIELIEPINESSSIFNFSNGYHHICYEVDDNSFIDDFKLMKIGKIFTKPITCPALNNRVAVFACLTNGLFVEFLLPPINVR